MIARVSGMVENCTSSFHGISCGPAVNKTTKSAQLQGDLIWAIRFAKVHIGLLRPRWMQIEETVGAALDAREEEEESVG
ncbi:hypothetical protein HZ326_24727 [Fusarium oxysporum f. sp. albedinis]|nr:hypothetical protein HZ326_24727 [Fusarium oxysporum f. sp. albedinis]